jgi:hypothetical protein
MRESVLEQTNSRAPSARPQQVYDPIPRQTVRAIISAYGGSALDLPFPGRRAAPGEAVALTRRPSGDDYVMPHQVANHAA